ncbi:NUDIX domain-containing protein [uncultured Dokdonia sp.]|uniref:NUDIX hydrolase n=1 Tax=uncultured Dokdonia sp. TaxID=575653 RepID=UPI00260D2FC5|nr:NUDIX domain-containing protein [uncultured Dokdonia sp.]
MSFPNPQIKLTVDAIVFGYNAGKISILLIQRKYDPFKGQWAIPGGFVLEDESLEEAVHRELKEETGVSINYLEQLYTFGAVDRDPRGRVVSVAYFGLIHPDGHTLEASTDAELARWFEIDDLPELSFDHKHILNLAIERLKGKITYEPIGFELLETKFPFSDLEKLYTTLLGRPVDRRNFRKKINNLNILDELDEKISLGAGRPASLFKFNEKRYKQLKEEGIIFEI